MGDKHFIFFQKKNIIKILAANYQPLKGTKKRDNFRKIISFDLFWLFKLLF